MHHTCPAQLGRYEQLSAFPSGSNRNGHIDYERKLHKLCTLVPCIPFGRPTSDGESTPRGRRVAKNPRLSKPLQQNGLELSVWTYNCASRSDDGLTDHFLEEEGRTSCDILDHAEGVELILPRGMKTWFYWVQD